MKKVCLLTFASLCVLLAPRSNAVNITENFSSDPKGSGWKIFGNTNLFQWNSTNQNLEATWDSSHPNSCFYRPLGTILTRSDDFSVAFDLRLSDFIAGVDPRMPSPFPLSIGFLNTAKASQSNFFRGTGYNSPDIVEFSFFPDPGGTWQWGPSLTANVVDSTGFNWGSGGFDPRGLSTNDLYRITLTYAASTTNLTMTITQNGNAFVTNSVVRLGTTFTDFRVDAISVSSYSQQGQDTNDYGGVIYAGSILAHGTVDNFAATLPPAPIQNPTGALTNNSWRMQFTSTTNWTYLLERSTDFSQWTATSATAAGTGGQLSLTDTNSIAGPFYFYRVRAER